VYVIGSWEFGLPLVVVCVLTGCLHGHGHGGWLMVMHAGPDKETNKQTQARTARPGRSDCAVVYATHREDHPRTPRLSRKRASTPAAAAAASGVT
jgi:hypothetical protein